MMEDDTLDPAVVRPFLPEAGHPALQARIRRMVAQDRLPHALLFTGPEGCGKDRLALAVAQFINCASPQNGVCHRCAACRKMARLAHPDLRWIFPTPAETKSGPEDLQRVFAQLAENPYTRIRFPGRPVFIGIDTIRELKKEAGFQVSEGRRKVFLISQAEQMRPEAANALLKLLEEPPPNLLLILTTTNLHRLLPTVRSRCQILRFSPLPTEQALAILSRLYPREPEERLQLVLRLSQNNLKRAQDFLDEDWLAYRDLAIEFLRKVVLINRAHELLQLLEPIAQTRQREPARAFLWFLLLWFQDVLHLRTQLVDAGALNNSDLADNLQRFIQFLPQLDVEQAVWLVEQALQQLDDPRNFTPMLILLELAIKLNQVLKKQESS